MAPMKRTHSGTTKEPSHPAKTMKKEPSQATNTMDLEMRELPAPGTGADDYFHNLYRSEIDFRQLARQDPAFAKLYAEPQVPPLHVMPLTMNQAQTGTPRLR